MDVSELRQHLEDNAIREQAYGLLSIGLSDQYCLVREGGQWTTFYFERGERWAERNFETEDEACRYFLEWVLSDPMTQEPRGT